MLSPGPWVLCYIAALCHRQGRVSAKVSRRGSSYIHWEEASFSLLDACTEKRPNRSLWEKIICKWWGLGPNSGLTMRHWQNLYKIKQGIYEVVQVAISSSNLQFFVESEKTQWTTEESMSRNECYYRPERERKDVSTRTCTWVQVKYEALSYHDGYSLPHRIFHVKNIK
jgi:hypothetical protein